MLELDYLERAPARFGYYVRRPRVVNIGHFLDDLREKGHEFRQEEWTQLSMIDVLLEAQHPHTREPIYLALEVSWMLFPHEIERAHQRAELLRAHGVNAYAAVAGEGFVPEAHEMAVQHKVLMLTDRIALRVRSASSHSPNSDSLRIIVSCKTLLDAPPQPSPYTGRDLI